MTNLEKLNEFYVGKKYFMLTINRVYDSGKRRKDKHGNLNRIVYWIECTCECGKIKHGERATITSGQIQSCGCKHGFYFLSRKHRAEFFAWMNIKARCYKESHKEYINYGGRGIKMCDEWLNSFEKFFNYIGNRPSKNHSIDRPNNDGNYEPGNVRWATDKEQCRNYRRNVNLTYNGETMCISAWSEKFGWHRSIIRGRLLLGWSIERALSTPNLGRKKS